MSDLKNSGQIAELIVQTRKVPLTANEFIDQISAINKILDIHTASLRAERDKWKERAERAETQLAGCGTAALGWNQNPAKQGDWGWSPSHQDVLDLRRRWESSVAERDAALEREAGFKEEVSYHWLVRRPEGYPLECRCGWTAKSFDVEREWYTHINSIPITAAADAQVAVMKLEARRDEHELFCGACQEGSGMLPEPCGQFKILESDLTAAIARRDEIVRGK